MERRSGFDDPDSGHRPDDGRRRDRAEQSGHRGPIVALSRRGLLPQAHRRVEPQPITETELPSPARLSSFLNWLRARAREEMQSGGDWRSVFDGLRPHVQAIWRAMPSRSRQRFLEHARPWWDIHRHRMAPEVEAKIRALQESGQLRILPGHLLKVDAKRDGASVSIRPRASEAVVRLEVSRIVSCRGLTSDPRRSSNPLVAQLVAEGYARADPLGIGLDVDNDCAIVDASGRRFGANLRCRTDEPGRLLGIDRRPRHSPSGRVSGAAARRAGALACAGDLICSGPRARRRLWTQRRELTEAEVDIPASRNRMRRRRAAGLTHPTGA